MVWSLGSKGLGRVSVGRCCFPVIEVIASTGHAWWSRRGRGIATELSERLGAGRQSVARHAVNGMPFWWDFLGPKYVSKCFEYLKMPFLR